MNDDPQTLFGDRLRLSDGIPILRRGLWLIIAAVVLCMLGAIVVCIVAPREYRSTAVIRVSTSQGQEIDKQQVASVDLRGFQEVERFYRTQVQLFHTQSFATRVSEAYAAYSAAEIDPRRVQDGLEVFPLERSQLIEVSMVDTDPERSAVLANLAAQQYVSENLDWRRQTALDANEWVDDRLTEVESRRAKLFEKMLAYKAEHNLIEQGESGGPLWSRLDALEDEYGKVSSKRVLFESTVSGHKRLRAKGDLNALAMVEDLPLSEGLRDAVAGAKSDVALLSGRVGPKHPEYKRADSSLKSLSDQLRREVDAAIEAEESKLRLLRDQESRLFNERQTTKDEVLERQRVIADFSELTRQLGQLDQTQKSLLKRRDELELSGMTRLNNAQLVDEARVPSGYVRPRISLILVAGLAMGLLIGLGLALLRGLLDDTIRSPQDVESFVRLPLLGVLPTTTVAPDGPRELMTHRHPRSGLAEAIRGVRTILANQPDGRKTTTILVTSSLAGEGKTSLSVGLSIAFAQQGRRVCLVEGDLRRPRLRGLFAPESVRGVADVLNGRATIEESIVSTEIPGMSVFPGGKSPAGSVELLCSEAFPPVLDELNEMFDCVIIDTPPAASLSDAVTLSRLVDAVVLVARAGRVSRSLVRHTIRRIQIVGSNVAGVVVNDYDGTQGHHYGYYGYYGGYAADEESDEPGEAAK
ncbi:MAG: GumC family protein [Myxococcota bacterium]